MVFDLRICRRNGLIVRRQTGNGAGRDGSAALAALA